MYAGSSAPIVPVSFEPVELIRLLGHPALAPVAGTSLLWVSNTECDLFHSNATGAFIISRFMVHMAAQEASPRTASAQVCTRAVLSPMDHTVRVVLRKRGTRAPRRDTKFPLDDEQWAGCVPLRLPTTMCVHERLPPGAAGALLNRSIVEITTAAGGGSFDARGFLAVTNDLPQRSTKMHKE